MIKKIITPSDDAELDPQLEIFCTEFIVDLNGTRAAIRAGYSKNEKSAAVQASRLLRNAKVQHRIRELIKEKTEKVGVTVEWVLERLMHIADSDPIQAFDEKGRLRSLHDMPIEIRKSIASVEVEQLFDGVGKDRYQIGDVVKVKFWDKNKSLENLGRWKKMFVDKVQIDDKSSLGERLARARKRRGK